MAYNNGMGRNKFLLPRKPGCLRRRKPILTESDRAVYDAILAGDESAIRQASEAVLLRVLLSKGATPRRFKDIAYGLLRQLRRQRCGHPTI